MTDDKLRQEAEIASVGSSHCFSNCQGAYIDGNLAAAAAREKELATLRARVAELEARVNAHLQRMGFAL